MENESFRDLGVDTLHFWMDNGPAHFRTYELLGFMMDLSSKFTISLDYFTEYHGKCICDGHSSKLTGIYDRSSKSYEIVGSTQEFIDLIVKEVNEINER